MRFSTLIRTPSAFLPLAMSLAALATVAIAVAVYGVDAPPQPDEGAAAHLFQLLIAGQVPIVGYFAIRWLPKAPRQALGVLALQAAAGLAALAPVFVLGL